MEEKELDKEKTYTIYYHPENKIWIVLEADNWENERIFLQSKELKLLRTNEIKKWR